jgi:hypothetical protein
MYTIAAKQLRSGMVRCRPPYHGRRGTGSSGSTIAHSSSETSSTTSLVVMTANHPVLHPRSETTSKPVSRHDVTEADAALGLLSWA